MELSGVLTVQALCVPSCDKKSNGPKTVPWGTLDVVTTEADNATKITTD